MKKSTLLLLLALLPLGLWAQGNSRPLLEEGKTWHYTYYNWATEERYQFVEYLAGDTIVDGKVYMKNYNEQGQVNSLLRETDGKVYAIILEGEDRTESLLYDFKAVKGDMVSMDMVVGETSIVDVFNAPCKSLLVCKKEYDAEGHIVMNVEEGDLWIEGMGSHGGLFNLFPNHSPGNHIFLDYIEMADGKEFRFPDVTAVKNPLASRAMKSSVYDLQGREIKNAKVKSKNGGNLPKGVYIVNGKKVVIK